MTKLYFVYILASKRNGTLYVGVTNNLESRTYQHQNDIIQSFSSKYSVHMLVYFEQTASVQAAISREKRLKQWRREWKIALIETTNPDWRDLSQSLFDH